MPLLTPNGKNMYILSLLDALFCDILYSSYFIHEILSLLLFNPFPEKFLCSENTCPFSDILPSVFLYLIPVDSHNRSHSLNRREMSANEKSKAAK